MKIIIIIISVLFISNYCQAQQPDITDTLQWLKTNIEQRNSFFSGKPFKTILDSLYGLKAKLVEYNVPQDIHQFSDEIRTGKAANKDTLFVDELRIYLDSISDGGVVDQLHEELWTNNFKNNLHNTINTHVKFIRIVFSSSVPFLRSWCDSPLGSRNWTLLSEGYFGSFIVQSVSVGEY